jgi:hypothetical protein
VRGQVIFELSFAAVYAHTLLHVVFGIFVAVIFVYLVRGIILSLYQLAPVREAQLSAERLWLTFLRTPLAVTGVSVTSADMVVRATRA